MSERVPPPASEGIGAGDAVTGYTWPVALATLAIALAAALALYWPGVLKLVRIWTNSETYAHGMLILPIALYLAWTRRFALARLTPRPGLLGIPLLAALGLAWMAGRLADVTSVQTFIVVALVPVLTLTVLGSAAARVLAFPLAFTFFAWPFGNFLVPVLQDYTAWFSVLMLKLSGIPVFIEGRFISIPAGNFVVADVCSGIRYLIASVALGVVYAWLMYRGVWRRAAFVALAIVAPILANGLRAYGIIMIAHWTDMEHAVGVDHLIYGWVFFLFVMILLFWAGSFFRDAPADVPRAAPDGAARAPLPAGVTAVPLAFALVALLAGPSGEGWFTWRAAQAAQADASQGPVPPEVMAWGGPHAAVDEWRPRYAESDATVRASYRRGEAEVGLYMLHYRPTAEGSDLVRYDNRIVDDTDTTWRRASEARRTVELPGGARHEAHETVMRGAAGVSRIVWHWYQVGGTVTTSPVAVKLLEAWATLRGDSRGSLLVAVTADYRLAPDEARDRIAGFIAAAGPEVAIAPGRVSGAVPGTASETMRGEAQ